MFCVLLLRRPRATALPRTPHGGSAKVRIDSVDVIDSTLPRRLVLAADLHQDELLENWRLARAGETLRELYERVRTGVWPDRDVAA